MARAHTATSSQYLQATTVLGLTASPTPPLTFAGWWYGIGAAAVRHVMFLSDASASQYYGLSVHSGNKVRAFTKNVTSVYAETSTTVSANTWHHTCGVFAAVDERTAYLDAGGETTETTSQTPGLLDTTAIGALVASGGPYGLMNGWLQDVAVWAAELIKAEVAQLAAGYCPLLIRPDALIAYWPLGGIYGVNAGNAASGDLDIVGGYHLSPVNTPGVAEHKGIIYPGRQIFVPRFEVVGGIVVLRRRRECA